MGGSKTPGQNNAASDKFLEKQAEAQGLGAPNAPGRTEGHLPGEAPVASDSALPGRVGVVNNATNVPGEKGLGGAPVTEEMQQGQNKMV
ncbi:hypothetical protein F4808DRAFT_247230 [Astrocystis sublimbata]|nr:hypothetical protein F4808DRAFT_247230 [Astrocystis sublimbata]